MLRASSLDSASAGFEILPFMNQFAELLSLDDNHLEVVLPLDLSVATARMLLSALHQISPAFLNSSSGLSYIGLDGLSKLNNNLPPDVPNARFEILHDFLAALGSLIARFEESAVLLLGFGQSSLVDHVAVLLEEGVRSF